MNILITGASGFVGQNLVTFLKEREVKIATVSLRDEKTLLIAADTTTVIHLAGKAHDLKKVSNEAAYFEVNTELTKRVYERFCESNADTFIYMSSVKAVADNPLSVVNGETVATPITPYGKSKLAAEQYLVENQKSGTQLYILRPCMIHGPNNKGNLNLLYQLVQKGIPYPLGSFSNQRSYLSVDNLCFIINELIQRTDITSGIYTLADDGEVSTTDLVRLIGESLGKKATILSPPVCIINFIAKIGDKLNLPLNTERLQKMTENYVVSNEKINAAIGKVLPMSNKEGLLKTFNSFKN
jgi:nucleoside-diphosphate-sugar epimerase